MDLYICIGRLVTYVASWYCHTVVLVGTYVKGITITI